MFHMYSSLLEPSPQYWSRLTHFRCKKSLKVFDFSLHRLVFATNSTLQFFFFFFEKYYKAHIGTKLAYKTNANPLYYGDSQAL